MDFNCAIRQAVSTVVLLVGSCLLAPPAFSNSVEFTEVALFCDPDDPPLSMVGSCVVDSKLNGVPEGYAPNRSQTVDNPFVYEWWFKFDKNQYLQPKDEQVRSEADFFFGAVFSIDFFEAVIGIAGGEDPGNGLVTGIGTSTAVFQFTVSNNPFPFIQEVHFELTCFPLTGTPSCVNSNPADSPTITFFSLSTESGFIRGISDPGSIPEPATIALLAIGLAGIGFERRKTDRQGIST